MYFLMSECTADPVDGASLTSDPTADAMESAPEVALSMLLVLVLVPPFGDKGGAPLLARRIVTGSVEFCACSVTAAFSLIVVLCHMRALGLIASHPLCTEASVVCAICS